MERYFISGLFIVNTMHIVGLLLWGDLTGILSRSEILGAVGEWRGV
jgi:hypothetical protein